MSRIDEALKRAASTRQHDRSSGIATESHAPVPDASTLERYAVEAPASYRPEPRPEPRVVKPAAVAARPPVAIAKRPLAIASAYREKLVVGSDITPYTLEQYRRLATVLNELQLQRAVKTLMVSSAAPREGKTLTITNLALTFSEAFEQRVLLIDADLRRPSLHEVFGVTNGKGLTDVVRNPAQPMPLVEISPCLSVLTAGQTGATPLAHLASDALPDAVAAAAERFDWVLLDTPPIGLLPDAQLIARICQAALFVVGAGVTPYSFVQRSIAALGTERVVGVVLNRIANEGLPTGDYYHDYRPTR